MRDNKMKCFFRELDYASQPLPGMPIVEIAGESRVLVENHRGVCKYTGEVICIKVGFGQLQITGSSLILKRMTKDQLIISGKIDAVALIRRKKNA